MKEEQGLRTRQDRDGDLTLMEQYLKSGTLAELQTEERILSDFEKLKEGLNKLKTTPGAIRKQPEPLGLAEKKKQQDMELCLVKFGDLIKTSGNTVVRLDTGDDLVKRALQRAEVAPSLFPGLAHRDCYGMTWLNKKQALQSLEDLRIVSALPLIDPKTKLEGLSEKDSKKLVQLINSVTAPDLVPEDLQTRLTQYSRNAVTEFANLIVPKRASYNAEIAKYILNVIKTLDKIRNTGAEIDKYAQTYLTSFVIGLVYTYEGSDEEKARYAMKKARVEQAAREADATATLADDLANRIRDIADALIDKI